MVKFRIDKIDELSRQLAFTPQDTRIAQIQAAEALLPEIDPAKAYPLDFIIFRITGYNPKTTDPTLLTGIALQHDLGRLIEEVSVTLSIRTDAMAEPVLTIEEVTERFNVTSKTIQRWRRRGLSARRFVFPDGKRRVGFVVSAVERFVDAHRDQVSRAANFSQVTENERDEILRRARRLAVACHCCVNEISRRIGKKLNRSPLTVAHIIKQHDQDMPGDAIFARAADVMLDEDRAQIVRAYRRGTAIKALARRMCRPKSAIYRVVVEDRVARLNKRKVKFIDDPLYHQPQALAVVDEILRAQDVMDAVKVEETRIPRDLPPYLQELYRTALLSPARERAIFLKLNFHKFEFVTARRKLEPQFARAKDLNHLEWLRRRYIDVKNQIIRANLRLVVSVARKHLRPGIGLMELISDGNLTLMRAVDSFDFHRGNRFSTYATLALMKGFARSVPEMQAAARSSAFGDARLASVPDGRYPVAENHLLHCDHVQQLLAQLEPFEQEIIRAHYGLVETGPATYEQVGSVLGLSKQRVRQIERLALQKLRATVMPGLS